MELLQGEDLGKRLRKQGRLPIELALHVLEQVLEGLSAVHQRGVVHRDLKPDNVLLITRDGDRNYAKLVDFGMSKIDHVPGGTAPVVLTRRGVVLGTPLYMSPEQARAAPHIDARSDLYSAGAMLYECVAGRPPHVGPTYEQILIHICTEDAPDVRRFRPEAPAELAQLLEKALAREPEDRFQTAEAMRRALLTVAGTPPPDPAVRRRRARARMLVALLVAALAGALVTLLAITLVGQMGK
jgi:serine/threonine-protein kinase